MALCTPTLIGPVTSWSSSLLVAGTLPGAKVTVREETPGGRVVLEGTANGGRDRLPLLAGVTLKPEARLIVSQELGDVSGWTASNVALTVGHPPLDYLYTAPVGIRSRVFECGRAVWIAGGVPGAEVIFSDENGVLGTAVADEGDARIDLTTPVRGGSQTVHATQRAPAWAPFISGTAPVGSKSVLPLPVAFGERLDPPRVDDPKPNGCDAAVVVHDVVDGAQVTITLPDNGLVETAIFDLDTLTFLLDSPLPATGGKMTIFQAVYERCGVEPSEVLTLDFPPAGPPPQPIIGRPCAGASSLHVENVKPGALVSIEVEGVVYTAMAAPDRTAQDFEFGPIPADAAGGLISVWQTACGLDSVTSTAYIVEPEATTPPVLAEPLYICARVVRVNNVAPGARVRIVAKGKNGRKELSGLVWSATDTIAIDVSPYLAEGDMIFAEQVICSADPLRSEEVPAEATPDLEPVKIRSAYSTQTYVTVDAVPGASVSIYAGGGQFLGSSKVDPAEMRVFLNRPLDAKSVYAVQEMCSSVGRPGPEYTVMPGRKVFELAVEKLWPVTNEGDLSVTWVTGSLTVYQNGSYAFFGDFRNDAEETYLSLDAWVTLSVPTQPPFQPRISISLASSNLDDETNAGYLAAGYKTEDADTTTGSDGPFGDSGVWAQIAGPDSSAVFDWLVTFSDFPEYEENVDQDGDPPEKPSGKGSPPPSK